MYLILSLEFFMYTCLCLCLRQVSILNKIKNCHAALSDSLIDFDAVVRYYDVILVDIRNAHGVESTVAASNPCEQNLIKAS